MTSQEIRQQFVDFFVKQHGHKHVHSSPVVPQDDPTLLFTNAGMNQFKPIFLGLEKRDYHRAANSQKCIRAGGKHNDLDDVGKDTYHHTFFEMLGNWSFGDYFKKEAIAWAWDLLTNKWGLDKSRLHATVFMGDPAEGLEADYEAEQLWRTVTDINPNHIHKGRKKDNFWEMGDTGPCGPCSEIHIDLTPDKTGASLVNAGDARVMEIWNLVFIQYNRGLDGKLNPLPAKHVDTGMGFERVCSVIQNAGSNYNTDVFKPLMDAIGELASARYTGKLDLPMDTAFRVIADHARMSTFAITDGARPGNKKRDAVLRSVIRRAVRYGYQIMKFRDPFLHRLVPVIQGQMGDAFPELNRNSEQVGNIIKEEETSFFATVERGLAVFEDAAKAAGAGSRVFDGKIAFDLHQELGFPIDMTAQLVHERGLSIDRELYDRLWREHIQTSGQGRKQHAQVAVDLTGIAKTEDAYKYNGLASSGKIVGWIKDSNFISNGTLSEDQPVAILLDKTNFYAEQGGQAGDTGLIRTETGEFEVVGAERQGDQVLHWGRLTAGTLSPGQTAALQVSSDRLHTMRNHTGTHLLNWALRQVLGDHVEQKGSLVDPEKLRFDFSHDKPVTLEQIARVEALVNEKIYLDQPVSATIMPLADAKKLHGVRAMFGEKYPDPVRVIAIGTEDPRKEAGIDHSIEFCGGTHLSRTGQAGFLKVVSEENVAKGVRRITAVTGAGAVAHVQKLDREIKGLSSALSVPSEQLSSRVTALQEEIKALKKKLASGAGMAVDPVVAAGKLLDAAPDLSVGKLIVGEIAGASDEQLRTAMDWLKKKCPSCAVMLASAADDKVNFVCAVTDDLIAKGLKAGDWIRETAKVAGGGGGGRPNMAQAGGKDPAKLQDALAKAREVAQKF